MINGKTPLYLVQHDFQRLHGLRIHHRNFCTFGCMKRSFRRLDLRGDLVMRVRLLRSTEIACLSLQMNLLRIPLRAVAERE